MQYVVMMDKQQFSCGEVKVQKQVRVGSWSETPSLNGMKETLLKSTEAPLKKI